ncbi:hypothetical protein G7Y89_g2172 [Cudoniella acicularis]|uniref:Bromo domain-containing protein n=1 Tax=Cudoniella acicularis TaxID=354080 RepID=A0A8H4W8W0_9HELO|nr:hypothetical protein G7Y89_g2172 [Cudoniella acicularis]
MASHMNNYFNPFSPVLPEQILTGAGLTAIHEMLALSLGDPGDGILVSRPIYGRFELDFGNTADLKIVYANMGNTDPFELDVVGKYRKAFENAEKIRVKIRALTLLPARNNQRDYEFCEEKQIHMISDEVYALSVYETVNKDAPTFTSALSINPDGVIDPERLHILYGMSKDFAAAGLRLGCLITKYAPLRKAIAANIRFHNPSGMSIAIGTKILENKEFVRDFIALSRKRLSEAYGYTTGVLEKARVKFSKGGNAGFFLYIDLRPWLFKDISGEGKETIRIHIVTLFWRLKIFPNPSLLNANQQILPTMAEMANQGVDLTGDTGQLSTTVSWHEPHPIFVIVLVGKEEIPYGIQKDLLCAQSPFYREHFAKQGQVNQVEHLVKLPDTDIETFGCFQNFIYTSYMYDKRGGREIPDYPLLMGVWKLATQLKMAPLRASVLDVMAERRQTTNAIPGTALLKQAWKETEEGSGLRKMLIGWAAEHMRSSPDIRNTFAKSLPQEILSELVIVMSELPATPAYIPQALKHPLPNNPVEIDFEQARPVSKRARKSDAGIMNSAPDDAFEVKPVIKKPARKSEPGGRKVKGRVASGRAGLSNAPIVIDPEKDMVYCRDLIHRMLSGPGFWTRLVGPFRDPVDPTVHNAPNYFDVVKRPIDLNTIQRKMNNNEYTTSQEFEADIRLIFQNCYEYWTPEDPVFKDCENFEKYFNTKWAERHKWVPPYVKTEVID